jgi:hypothetical protein
VSVELEEKCIKKHPLRVGDIYFRCAVGRRG